MLWYWNQPEDGMDMEDCEKIAMENSYNYPKDKFLKNMYIAFV